MRQGAPTLAKLQRDLDKLAEGYVSRWIQDGLYTYQQTDAAKIVIQQFASELLVNQRYFAETGRYPAYRHLLNADGTDKVGE